MARTLADLQEIVEQYFQGVDTQRKRALAILRAIEERFIARDVAHDDVWFQSPGAEDEKPSTANAALEHFPENTNEWTVELVTRVRAGQSYTLFYNPITIKFDSPTGTARLLIQGNEIAHTEVDSSPSNQDALARFCDTLFDNMASSFEPGSEARRKIGFSPN